MQARNASEPTFESLSSEAPFALRGNGSRRHAIFRAFDVEEGRSVASAFLSFRRA